MQKLTMRPVGDGLRAFIDAEMGPDGNTSGLRPYGRNIVVMMDELAASSQGDFIVGQATGVVYTDRTKDECDQKSSSGCIMAMGPEAFARYENGHTWTGDKPKVGDRVEVVQYSGKIAQGADRRVYRIMDQNCIIAGIDLPEMPIGDVQ